MRVKFTNPALLTFVAMELEEFKVDPDTGNISGNFSLLRPDGTRTRSIGFNETLKNFVDNLSTRVCEKLMTRTFKVDNQDVVLAGVVQDVPPGSPVG